MLSSKLLLSARLCCSNVYFFILSIVLSLLCFSWCFNLWGCETATNACTRNYDIDTVSFLKFFVIIKIFFYMRLMLWVIRVPFYHLQVEVHIQAIINLPILQTYRFLLQSLKVKVYLLLPLWKLLACLP